MKLLHFFIFVIAFLSVSLCFAKTSEKQKPIKILAWQEYVAPEVVQKLKAKNDFDLDITTYLTNDMAVSRLVRNEEKFEVAIVSNVIYNLLYDQKIITPGLFESNSRSYLTVFKDVKKNCTPFFWLVSGYLYDAKVLPTAPRSIDSLLNLAKDSKVYVGIVDDPIEVAYRIMGDHNRKIQDLDIYPAPLWKNVRFIIDIPRFFPFEKIAIFTWHGIANQHLLSKDNLSFALPLQNLQVGYDLVCIVSKEKRRFSYLKDFVLKLTSEEHTEVNIKYNQYFSPYVDPVHAYLHPRFKKIYSESLQKLSSGNYVETRMMRGQQLKLVNEWWHKRRYGQ